MFDIFLHKNYEPFFQICDCSQLTKSQIEQIEADDFIVMHISIRRFINEWFYRFNVKEINNILAKQFQVVKRFQLSPLTKDELKQI